MVETEANDHAIELHVTKDIDTNDFVEATRESEKINDVDVNIESDDNEVNDESILGKVFDTAEDAYDFYNDYSFLHGFGIRKNDIFKSLKTNEPFRKIYVCNKEGFKRIKKTIQVKMRQNVVEMLEPNVKQGFELQYRRMGNG
ncbi:unnamed protein product [Lactuca saligna]|nr:unnamed protein product [Lactuca saligna]